MTQKWTRVAMKGKSQAIPPVCPNCLGPGSLKFRYGYKGIEGWLMRTTYYQTFTYCADCQPQAVSAVGLRRWGMFGGIMTFIAWIVLFVMLIDAVRSPETGRPTSLNTALVLAVTTASALGLGGLIYLAARALKRRRHPRRPGQAVWGLAAFYTGGTHFGFNTSNAVYKAVRPEWIAALVKANPEQVDEAVYQSHLGAARPSLVQAGRPFGPS
jgi:hypothetical protein